MCLLLKMPYFGESKCSEIKKDGKECENMAYYEYKNSNVCGVHSKEPRKKLKMNPNLKANLEAKLINDMAIVKSVAKSNKLNGIYGNVICSKMRMMKPVEDIEGYLKIFPNYRHGSRKDGIGLPSLSPMSIGPINHNQPGLPQALNLENFHQGNKVFPSEVDRNENPTKKFFETQIQMYQDPIPHRHKSVAKGNVPLYSIWIDQNENQNRISYIESRQFYCTFYERHTKNNEDFKRLKKLINKGYNLQICGYDAYPIDRSIDEHYKDSSRPFGHELVLYTMLTCSKKDYPWRKYRTYNF